ncbi:MAG: indole-3-glycerol phosphate synthase TrpC [Candidatus Dormibacteria bacterium]
MGDVLDGIVGRVRESLAAHPPDPGRLWEDAQGYRRRDFRVALEQGPRPALIAEFKRRSPSKGALDEGAVLEDRCRVYQEGGATALSILTNPDFGGDLGDLVQARGVSDLPLLRKDFVIDPRQLLEAAAAGADCVLLVARIVAAGELVELAEAARELNLQTLVEVYEERELEIALGASPDMVGVNSRDLTTFAVDSGRFARVAASLPPGVPLVAESGITSREDVVAAGMAGARAVLVGEALMTAGDAGSMVRELLGGPPLVRS